MASLTSCLASSSLMSGTHLLSQTVEFQLARDVGGGFVAVRSSSSSSAIDIGCHVVELLAILVGNNVSSSASCVCPKNNPILPDHSTDGCPSFCHLWRLEALLRKHGVPLAVLEVEPGGRSLHWHQGRHRRCLLQLL